MRVSRQRQRELEVEATRLLRAAGRRKRAVPRAGTTAESPAVATDVAGPPPAFRIWVGPCSSCGAGGYRAHEHSPGHRDRSERLASPLHQVTGDMALKFKGATAADLARWAEALRAVAEEMAAQTWRSPGGVSYQA